MPKSDDWQRKKQEYDMYALFRTAQRAETKKQQRLEKKADADFALHPANGNNAFPHSTTPEDISSSRFGGRSSSSEVPGTSGASAFTGQGQTPYRRPTGSRQQPRTYQRPAAPDAAPRRKPEISRPDRATPKPDGNQYYRSIIRDFDPQPAETSRTSQPVRSTASPRNANFPNQRETTGEHIPAQHHPSVSVQRYRMRRTKRPLQRPHYGDDAPAAIKDRNEALFMMELDGGEKVLIHDTSMTEVEAVKVAPKIEIKTFVSPKKRPLPWGMILAVAFCTLLVMAMIYSYVRLNEMTSAVSEMDDSLKQLKSEQSDLELQIVKRSDLVDIEEKAQSELGMVKNEQLDKRYVAIEGNDRAEVVQQDEEKAVSRQTVILEDAPS